MRSRFCDIIEYIFIPRILFSSYHVVTFHMIILPSPYCHYVCVSVCVYRQHKYDEFLCVILLLLMLQEQLMNFQECIREVMMQSLLREQPEVETVSMTTADPLKDGDETQDCSDDSAAVSTLRVMTSSF